MSDTYNFYAVEFNQKKGYKKLLKSVNGVYTKLAVIKDGGLAQNQWYKIQIIAEREKIIIKIGSDLSYEKYSSLPIIFSVEDNTFISGS